MGNHILIIDDDLKLTELITKFLENHQFTVSSKNVPSEALKIINKVCKESIDKLTPCFVQDSIIEIKFSLLAYR